jgi:hypothetical protein
LRKSALRAGGGFGLFSKLTVLLLRQILGIGTDVAMEKKLRGSAALRAICRIGRAMDNTTISKARKWIGVSRLCKIWFALLAECKRAGLIKGRLVSVDSTEFWKYYWEDPDAEWGYCASKMEFFDGFKAHIVTDDLSELPIGAAITADNVHDAPLFGELLAELGKVFTYEVQKIRADCGYDAASATS